MPDEKTTPPRVSGTDTIASLRPEGLKLLAIIMHKLGIRTVTITAHDVDALVASGDVLVAGEGPAGLALSLMTPPQVATTLAIRKAKGVTGDSEEEL